MPETVAISSTTTKTQGTPSRWKEHVFQSQRFLIPALYLLGIFLFWVLRLYYWHITYEVPFSDLADDLNMGRQVAAHFDFRHSPFWQSFKLPVMPILLAITFKIFGDGNLAAWRFVQATILFVSLLWACREIYLITRNRYLVLTLLWIVALSKSSIFWSYKTGTESAGEAFVYLCIAASLFCLRSRRQGTFAWLGAIYMAATLLKAPFSVPIVLFCAGLLLIRESWRRKGVFISAFILGGLLVWLPWGIRSYRLYGHIVPLSTQKPYVLLWEVGAVTLVQPDGIRISRDDNQLMGEAESRFHNDYEAMLFADRFATEWLHEHYRDLPGIVLRRAANTIVDRREYLTHVSRTELLPGFYNRMLIDKTPMAVFAGIVGLLTFLLLYPRAIYPIAVIPIGFWILAASLVSYARMAEPSLPLFLFGNLAWVVLASRIIARVRKHGENDLGTRPKLV